MTLVTLYSKPYTKQQLTNLNISMRSMQKLFFGWAGCDGALFVRNVFIFEKENEHNFQTDENIALLQLKRKKKN